jgi:hypothetical protein
MDLQLDIVVHFWGIFWVLSPAARQRNPFVDTHFLEGPMAVLTLEIRMIFRVSFPSPAM